MAFSFKKNLGFIFFVFFTIKAHAVVNILAAENVYGEVAKEIGGENVKVTSVLNNPYQDPHLFNVTPSIIKLATTADIIIYNGADYDPWVHSLLIVQPENKKHIIAVSELMGVKKGDNPHIWYDPKTMPRFAQALTNVLNTIDKEHTNDYQKNLRIFNQHYQIIFDTVKNVKKRFQNTPVAATEPLFNDMAESLGLKMFGKNLQISIMNDLPPPISQIKTFEDALRQHTVAILIYNNQVVSPITKQMLSIAQEENIPIVGVSEMMPSDVTYIEWMQQNLQQLTSALEKIKSNKK